MKKLNIQVGQRYKTRTGSIILITKVNDYPMNKNLYQFIGVDIYSKFVHSFTSEGHFLHSKEWNQKDLIEQIN